MKLKSHIGVFDKKLDCFCLRSIAHKHMIAFLRCKMVKPFQYKKHQTYTKSCDAILPVLGSMHFDYLL